MSINRELSQLASFIDVQESNNFIGISTGGTYTVGIGTSSVTISSNGTITAPLFLGATGSSLIDHIDLQDEGSPVGTGFTTLNFVGAAVTITQGVTGVATITVDSAVVGGEDGAVQFASGGTLTGISTLLFADSTNHRIGIGSTQPTAKLDVNGTVNVTGLSTFSNHVTLTDNKHLQIGDNNELEFYHNGITGESLIQESGGGNFLIKGTNLHLQSATGEDYFVGTYNGSVELYYDDSRKFETVGGGVSVSSGTASTATIYGPGNLIIDPAPVDDNGGIVRIKGDLYVDGTTTEINSTTLTVDDLNVVVASGATNGLTADGAGLSVAGAGATIKYNYNGGSEQWVFNKAPYYDTDRLLTTADEGTGNGLDADTLDSLDSLSFLRSDAADIKTTGDIRFNNNIGITFGGSDNSRIFHDGTDLSLDLTAYVTDFKIRDGTTERYTFTKSGKLSLVNVNASGIITAQDFNSSSDENLKTNIRTIEDPLAKVVQIRGVNFDWKETQKPALGVIAQEVEKVLPELVTDNGTKTVNYNGLIGLLIEAVKAQQEEIDILKSKIK